MRRFCINLRGGDGHTWGKPPEIHLSLSPSRQGYSCEVETPQRLGAVQVEETVGREIRQCPNVWSESWCAKFLEGLGGSFRNMYLVYDSCWVSAVPMCQAVPPKGKLRQKMGLEPVGSHYAPWHHLAPMSTSMEGTIFEERHRFYPKFGLAVRL